MLNKEIKNIKIKIGPQEGRFMVVILKKRSRSFKISYLPEE